MVKPGKNSTIPRELKELLAKGCARKRSADGSGATPARDRRPANDADGFRAWVASLARSKRSTWGRETAEFADEIGCRLAELASKIDDPATGTELVAVFLETADSVLDRGLRWSEIR